MNKAVADGGILHALNHKVTARVARFTYGIEGAVIYDGDNEEHTKRRLQTYINSFNDLTYLLHRFCTILPAGTQVTETQEFYAGGFVFRRRTDDVLDAFTCPIMRYRGKDEDSLFMDTIADKVDKLCEIRIEPYDVLDKVLILTSPRGFQYYTALFDVVLLFGLTELKAQVQWFEQGVEKRSPACLVYPDEEA